MEVQRARSGIWPTLGASLGAVMLLVLVALGFSRATSLRTQEEVQRIVDVGERSALLIGRISLLTGRIYAILNEAPRSVPEARGPELEAGVQTLAELDSSARKLAGLLSPQERDAWGEAEAAFAAYSEAATESLALLAAGRDDEAFERSLAVGDLRRRVLEGIDRTTALRVAESQRMLEGTKALMQRARFLELSITLLLLLSIGLVAYSAIRVLRRKERELADYMRHIEDTNSELDAFAGRVAHDLRNTLSTMSLAGQVLRAASGDPAVVAVTGARIERTSQRADELVSSLLAFARAGAPPSAGASADVEAVLAGVAEELAPARERVQARLELSVDRGLRVRCDPALLRALLTNLLSNAFKFLEDRAVREVHVAARARGAECLVEVSDTGPGIPEAHIERIFEPFYRAPGSGASGQGIGLATALRIVEAYGGTLRVRSREGEGTVFSVVLPLHESGVLYPHRTGDVRSPATMGQRSLAR